jgi:hypothetical protein
MADGKTGTVRIDDQDFDLENGSLLLIETSGPKPAVKQLQGQTLKPDREFLKKIAVEDAEINAFFESAGTSESNGAGLQNSIFDREPDQ